MPGMRKGIHKEETYNKYADSAGKIEIGAIAKYGTFARMHVSEIIDGDP